MSKFNEYVNARRSALLMARLQPLDLDNGTDAAKVLFNAAYKRELASRQLTTETPDGYLLALFEEAYASDGTDVSQYPFFIGFAVDYLCTSSPLLWKQSAKDGVAQSVSLTSNEAAYVRQFIDVLVSLKFLDVLSQALDNVDPTGIELDDLEADVTVNIDVPGSVTQSFAIKCDAFQQAVACINMYYAITDHELLTVQEAIRLQ